MTVPGRQTGDSSDRTAFETRLQQLIADARDDDIQIEGAYDVRSPHPEVRDFQIEITEIAKSTMWP